MNNAEPPRRTHDLDGHRRGRLGRSPFANVAAPLAAAVCYAVAAAVWAVSGDLLPGGRWLIVHLFTLGVLTNAILAFSEHFGHALTRGDEARGRWQTGVLNGAIVLTLAGLPGDIAIAVGIGGAVVTAIVAVAWLRLRRLRNTAPDARFAWIVAVYERAHEAFLVGAAVGVALGVGAVSGAWYVSGRLAHLHLNVLGWGGLTLVATLVFFGPTVVRTQMVRGADRLARRAVPAAVAGVAIGVIGLVLAGIDSVAGTVARVGAAAGFAAFALAATVMLVPVARAAVTAKPSAPRWHLVAVTVWFVAVAWADALVVGLGAWRLLDALGLAMLLGVLLQAIAMVAMYVAPQLRGRSFAARDVLLARFEAGATARVVAFNLGTLLLAVAAAAGSGAGAVGAIGARAGGALVIAAVLSLVVIGVWPVPEDPDAVRSQVARRYRDAPPSVE